MTTHNARAIDELLEDKEYRHSYVESHIRELLALQIRKLREARVWTQADLGREAGMAQERISVLEDPDNAGVTLRTLKRLGEAFDVALIVRYVAFSELLGSHIGLSTRQLTPPPAEQDGGLQLMKRRLVQSKT